MTEFYAITAANTLIQAMSPDAMRGRAISILSMLILGVSPFGALMAGILAQHLGPSLTVSIGGLACIAGAILCSVDLPALTVKGRQLIVASFMPAGMHR